MSDLKKRQEEFRSEQMQIAEDGYFSAEGYRGKSVQSIDASFAAGFDAFRLSPEYLEMKEALEFYAQLGHDLYAPSSMTESLVKADGGEKAREVLSQLTESEGKK